MNDLSVDLIDFIGQFIQSIEQLEVLLLLRELAERSWTAEEVNDVIRSDIASITRRLEHLASIGLVAADPDGRYRYATSSSTLDALVGDLATAYRERRTRVIELMYSKPKRGLHDFSNAFVVIKKEPKDG